MTPFQQKDEGSWGKDHRAGAGRRFPRTLTEPPEDPAGLAGLLARTKRFFTRGVWLANTDRMGLPQRVAFKLLRIAGLAVRGFVRDRCLFRAQALTFITVLSIVPLLAFSVSVAKGFGAYDRLRVEVIEPFLDEHFGEEPGAAGPPAVDVGAAGSAGDATAEGGGPRPGGPGHADAADRSWQEPGGARASEPSERAFDPGHPAADSEGFVVPDKDAVPVLDPADPDADPAGALAPATSADGTLVDPGPARGEGPPLDPGAATVAPPAGGPVGLRGAIDKILTFVEDTDFASIGIFGLALLLYTVIKLLSSIEGSFNEIYGVERARPLVRKVSDYLSVLVVVPILLIAATGAMTALKANESLGGVNEVLNLGPVMAELARLGGFFATWAGFTFVYLFMPNTKVRLFSALLGGLLGGGLWLLAQYGYRELQLGMANYNAIYAGLAAIPIFLVWVNISWITVLVGAELAFAHQNEPAFLHIARARDEDQSFRERVGLRALTRMVRAWKQGDELPEALALANELGVPERSLEDALRTLRDEGLLETLESPSTKDRRYAFARDPERISVKDVIDALKGRRAAAHLPPVDQADADLDELLDAYEREREGSDHNKPLTDLA